MKFLKAILKIAVILIAIPVAGFAGLIVYASVTDYKPADTELIARAENPSVLKDSSVLTLLTWNIGYAGLDKNMDFFKDGGTKVFTPEDKCRENLSGILSFLKNNDSIDFILIQEIDRKSRRSYMTDQYEALEKTLSGFNLVFAKNYDVFFVPAPLSKPMGKVLSGIAVCSKYIPESSARYSLPGNMGFPTQLFYLDRCFIVNRYKVEDGKELILINTHNEAFDEGGNIRKDQMQTLRNFVLSEYEAGNYVIVGGDWNQYPPEFKPAFTGNKAFTGKEGNFDLVGIESDYLPDDWTWIYDPASPSVRTLMAAYDPATTPTSVCDIFLVSPNLESLSVKSPNLDFAFSDHNPVIIKVKLR